MQENQRREVKKERACGTWHLSSTCWEPRLCKCPLCQVGITVATLSEVGRKWEMLERDSFIATVFLLMLFSFFAVEAVISSTGLCFCLCWEGV